MNNKKTTVSNLLTSYQHKLIEENIDFAMNMGKHFGPLGVSRGVCVEDLQQEACLGLFIAAQKYDPERGVSFATFAYNYCRKNIQNFISASSTNENITYDLELCGGIIDDHDNKESTYMVVDKLLDILSKRERLIICKVYGINCEIKGFADIGHELGLTSQHVHHIYEKAMSKMEFSNINNYENN